MIVSWSTQTFASDTNGDLVARSYEHSLEFDAVTKEVHEGVSVLTDHTVESGAALTDHKRNMPRKVTIEAVVSNTPLDAPPASGYGTSSVQARTSKDDDANAVVLRFSSEFDRVSDACSTLDRLRREATSVTITTAIRTYDNVQIVSVVEPRASGDGADGIEFSIEFQQVTVAETRTVDTPIPREPRAAPRLRTGGQEGTTGERASALTQARDVFDAAGGWDGIAGLIVGG